uniref:Putative ovule protein n=1 Tax=Solanum chacoense TaxID=4108 RepID=A0A0V0IG00_SOLCH
MLDTLGIFSTKSAWNYIRHREEPNKIYRWIWTKGVPFKMAFLMWRLWKFKIPVDDKMRRWGIHGPSRCWCCDQPEQETMTHVFLKSVCANKIWSYFCSFAGINIAGLSLRETIMKWWDTSGKAVMRPYYRALPSFVIWELWQRRNRKKHEGKNLSAQRGIHNITRHMHMLVNVRRPNMKCSVSWSDMLKELEEYCPELTTKLIKWECPPSGWCKYNTDGASRGNPGQSSYAFCLRNDKGDMIYVEAATIQSSTSTEAEAKAI